MSTPKERMEQLLAAMDRYPVAPAKKFETMLEEKMRIENEACGAFQIPLERIKVVDASEARTYACQSVLAILDANATDYSDLVLLNYTPVPVVDESGFQIGSASVRLEDWSNRKRIVAQLHLDYSTPERLAIETGVPKTWAWANIAMHADPQDKLRMLTVEVMDVMLRQKFSNDLRIDPIGKVLL